MNDTDPPADDTGRGLFDPARFAAHLASPEPRHVRDRMAGRGVTFDQVVLAVRFGARRRIAGKGGLFSPRPGLVVLKETARLCEGLRDCAGLTVVLDGRGMPITVYYEDSYCAGVKRTLRKRDRRKLIRNEEGGDG